MFCSHCSKECKSKNSLAQHQIRCAENPDRIPITRGMLGKKGRNAYQKAKDEGREYVISDETRLKISANSSISNKERDPSVIQKISDSMKLAHAEGRAWNIGMSRWNNQPSYPETFFAKVIENEFDDKGYVTEHPVGRFALDFAWLDKKRCIEIDGDQHEKEDYKARDARKDALLAERGWSVLRIKWKDMFSNTKHWIRVANDFIGSEPSR